MILVAWFQIHICTNGLMIKRNLNIFRLWLFPACHLNVIMSLLFHRWTCLTFTAHWKLVLNYRADVELVIKHEPLAVSQITWTTLHDFYEHIGWHTVTAGSVPINPDLYCLCGILHVLFCIFSSGFLQLPKNVLAVPLCIGVFLFVCLSLLATLFRAHSHHVPSFLDIHRDPDRD